MVPVVHDVLSQFADGGIFSLVEASVLVGVGEEALNAAVRRQIVGNVGAPEEVEVGWDLVSADLAVFVGVHLLFELAECAEMPPGRWRITSSFQMTGVACDVCGPRCCDGGRVAVQAGLPSDL
jgi:hypothetical protein